jgi:hypothetical protein
MKSHQSLLLTAIVGALVFPIASYAQDANKGMTGVMVHGEQVVDHGPATSNKSRAQVKKELAVAHKDGTHEMGGDVSTVKPPPATAGKSRQEVKKELANMTPEEKKKLKESNLGGK